MAITPAASIGVAQGSPLGLEIDDSTAGSVSDNLRRLKECKRSGLSEECSRHFWGDVYFLDRLQPRSRSYLLDPSALEPPQPLARCSFPRSPLALEPPREMLRLTLRAMKMLHLCDYSHEDICPRGIPAVSVWRVHKIGRTAKYDGWV